MYRSGELCEDRYVGFDFAGLLGVRFCQMIEKYVIKLAYSMFQLLAERRDIVIFASWLTRFFGLTTR